ncbi:MAG: RraA family protein [Pseudomonadota bacterium]
MPVSQYKTDYRKLSSDALKPFFEIPAAVMSDVLARGQTMQGGINPLSRDMRICAQARTAECPVGDNSAIRAAISVVEPGQVIVVNAQGYESTAVFGGLMALMAKEKQVAGLVIDGAVRDSQEIIDADLPMFCRGTCPRGPRKYPAGFIDGVVSVGGVSVAPGDIIIGDADGVTVVPLSQADQALKDAEAILAKESEMMERIAQGESLASIYGKVEIEEI